MKQFLRDTFVSAIGSLIGIGLLSIIGLFTFMGLLIAIFSGEKTTEIEDKSVLVFDLALPIMDKQASVTFEDALAGNLPNNLSLRQVITAIENAATDERISALFLQGDGGMNNNGFTTLKEIRNALVKFKESGKQIIAYDVDLSEGEYYLASLADRIILNPIGLMEINGLAFSEIFLTGALEKYGIGIQVVKVGNYKSAVEPLTRKDFSPENRQQTQELLNDLWAELTQTVTKTRPISPQKIQQIVTSQGFLKPQEALTNGFVDQVGYFDEVLTHLRTITETEDSEGTIPQISLEEYVSIIAPPPDTVASENAIAIVYGEGEIVDGQGDLYTVGGDSLAQTLRDLREGNKVKAVVLRINSPGGSVTASEVIWREVSLLNEKIPVIVSMGDLAASGGYWIATAGKYIFAENTTITGSIGVYGILPNFENLASNNGITWDVIKTGNFADVDTMIRAKTPQELKLYQESVNEVYNLFLERVAKARNLTKEKVGQIAQGRVWSGLDAQKIGLVNEIGGLNEAINYAVTEANLGNDWSIQEYPTPKKLEDEIIEKLLGAKAQTKLDPLTKEWLKVKQDLTFLRRLNDPQGIYAIFPYKLF